MWKKNFHIFFSLLSKIETSVLLNNIFSSKAFFKNKKRSGTSLLLLTNCLSVFDHFVGLALKLVRVKLLTEVAYLGIYQTSLMELFCRNNLQLLAMYFCLILIKLFFTHLPLIIKPKTGSFFGLIRLLFLIILLSLWLEKPKREVSMS